MHALSKLPFGVLYFLSDLAYFFVCYVFKYRKKVISQNLAKAFPQCSKAAQNQMRRAFYRYFCDQMFETLKSFSISAQEIKKRVVIKNPEILDPFFKNKQDFVHVVSHHCNWEWYAMAFSLLQKHQLLFIYKKIDNDTFEFLIKNMRQKFGAIAVPMHQTYEQIEAYKNKPHASFMGGDQSPRTTRNVYWTQFFNQETAVFWGIENIAKKHNQPLILAKMCKKKRGFYEVELEVIAENPENFAKGALTELHTRKLEKHLLTQPETWLWSHRRWKLKPQS